MEQLSLATQYTRLIYFIEKKTSGPYWLWKLVLFCAALSWFLAVPPYTVSASSDAWAFIKIQAADFLHPSASDMEVYIRRENMVMRWVLPLMYFLTRSVVMILLVQAFMGLTFLYLFLREIFRQTGDKVLTTFFGLGLSNIFVFSWFFVDTAGYGDSFAYFFLMLAVLIRNPILLFVCLQAAFFTDERALVASGYLILWWMTEHLMLKSDAPAGLPAVLRGIFAPRTWVVLLALGTYLVIRSHVMTTYFAGHSYTTMGTPVLFADMHRWGLGTSLWFSFEGMWIPLGAAGFALCVTGRLWHFLALLAGFLILIITGIFVHDIDRALGYGFPFLLISGLIFSKLIPLSEYRKLMFIASIFCIISPMCYTMGYNKVLWAEPLPLKALMLMDRVAGWGWFD